MAFAIDMASGQRRQQQQLALTASTSFRMILSPTALELKSPALRIVEEATTQQVLEYAASVGSIEASSVASVEIVFQREEFLPDVLATHISFFALATYRTEAADEVISKSERQSNLNTLTTEAFSTAARRSLFLQRIGEGVEAARKDSTSPATTEQLQILDSLVVASVLPFTASQPSEASSNGKLLSTLDIVLICISVTILIGILWMLFEHFKDRGYIENQRQQVLNSPRNCLYSIPRAYFEEGFNADEESAATKSLSATQSRQETYDSRSIMEPKDIFIEASPSTPSTIAGSMITFEESPPYSVGSSLELNSTAAIVGGVRPSYAVPAPRNLLPPFSGDSDEDSEDDIQSFETNWFRKATSIVDNLTKDARTGGDGDDVDETMCDSDDDDEDDVFHIDVAKAESVAPSPRSQSHSVSEWMRNIQVSPSDSRSSPSSTGTPISRSASLLDVASLDQRSFDLSMANE